MPQLKRILALSDGHPARLSHKGPVSAMWQGYNTMTSSLTTENAAQVDQAPVAGVTHLRVIPAGENFSAVTQYLGDRKVNAVFAIRRAEGKPRYEKKCLFDFSGVSEEQLYLLAMYGAKVKVQARLRDISEAEMLNPDTLSTVDVLADVVQAPRNSVDSVTAAIRLLARKSGATEDDVREALASFVASE